MDLLDCSSRLVWIQSHSKAARFKWSCSQASGQTCRLHLGISRQSQRDSVCFSCSRLPNYNSAHKFNKQMSFSSPLQHFSPPFALADITAQNMLFTQAHPAKMGVYSGEIPASFLMTSIYATFCNYDASCNTDKQHSYRCVCSLGVCICFKE